MIAQAEASGSRTPLHEIPVTTLEGEPATLARYRGQGAPDREWHRDRGFSVLGFPCNQFGHQEPGEAAQIRGFCERGFGVSFPMFAKIAVNAPRAHPLYRYLKAAQPGALGTQAIKWNFTKFLVGRGGDVVRRYGPAVEPSSLEPDVLAVLDRRGEELHGEHR